VALNRKLLPARARSDQELAARVRRAEEYAVLGAEVVVEMGSETYDLAGTAARWTDHPAMDLAASTTITHPYQDFFRAKHY
jgi:hypothetical protein